MCDLAEIHWGLLKSTEAKPRWIWADRSGFQFSNSRGLSKSTEAKPRWIWTTRGEFEQTFGEVSRVRDKCFQMLRGLSNCECYFVLIPRQGDLFPVREWEWVFTVSTRGQSWRRRTSSETGQCHTKLSGFEKYIENGFGKHTVSNRPRWVWLKPYSFL